MNIPTGDDTNPVWQLVFFLLLWQSMYRISNAAITALLRFFNVFGRMIGAFTSHRVNSMESVPLSADTAHQYLWSCKDKSFVTYVVCPACNSIYDYEDSFISVGTAKESKRCIHVPYPNHPHVSKRKECGALLLKKVKTGRSYRLVPIKAYPYQPLKYSLGRLVKKEGFVEVCEQWRQRQSSVPSGYYGDSYDGQVWTDFGARGEYSLGAIYLTIQNLPREERYREENVILVGLLPGPSEPKLTINSYLSPLVAELQEAWEYGIMLKTYNGTDTTFRVALVCKL